MTDSRREVYLGVQRTPSLTMQRFGSLVVVVSVVALAGAFVPGVTLFALVLGVAGIALGLTCLSLDRSFNVAGLIGTVVSSAAVSLSIIMGIVYG